MVSGSFIYFLQASFSTGRELYAEMSLLEMWGDAVLKTLMAFVTIFVLFNLHLSPSWGSCLALAFGLGNAAVLSSLTQGRKHEKNHLCWGSDGHGTRGVALMGWLHNRTELRPPFPVLTQNKISQTFSVPKSFS